MLRLPAPTPMNGDLLERQLADAGVPARVTLVGSDVVLDGADEANLSAVRGVLNAHPSSAEAALVAAQTRATNESTIRQQATAALQGNRDFLALQAPTNAQVVAQVRALTRQNQGLIRLALRRFDGSE